MHDQDNVGLGVSRNIGVDLAKGKYIYFLDGDEYLVLNVLSTLLKHLERFELDLIGFKTLYRQQYC